MKFIITPLIGLLLTLVSFIVAPIGMLLAVWFIKWDSEPTEVVTRWSTGPGDPNDTMMMTLGDLPAWFKWFQTPDFRFPCEPDEPAMVAMLAKYGRTFTSYWWAGIRNQMMGMAAAFGKPTIGYVPENSPIFWQRDDIWVLTLPLGICRFVTGWQVYALADKSFLAVPVFTLKRPI
jgi:hypothetical protein